MTKAWIMRNDVNNYRHLTYIDGDFTTCERSFVRELHTTKSIKHFWKAPDAIINNETLNKPLGDFINFASGLFVVSNRIAMLFKSHFSTSIEILPFNAIEDYSIIHIMDICDCIDYEQSEVTYFDDSKEQIMFIDRFVLKDEIINNKSLFKDNKNIIDFFVSNNAKNLIESWDTTGLSFIEVGTSH